MIPANPSTGPGVVRQIGGILALPFTVLVVVPLALLAWQDWPEGCGLAAPWAGARWVAGLFLAASGLALLISAIACFSGQGGTLAPWDPPRGLVARGPYRWVRNPMISGVGAILLAEALLAASWLLAVWFALFVLANALWIPLWEEPRLERRFGESYRLYKASVPRWLPRLRPWRPPPERG